MRVDQLLRMRLFPLFACMAAQICVEAALIAPGHMLAGEIADAVLLFGLLQVAPESPDGSERSRDARAATRGLALVPLFRLVALGLPLRDGSDPVGLLVTAILVGIATIALAPEVGVVRRALWGTRVPLWQVGAGVVGLGLGLVAYLLGAPALWPSGADGGRLVIGLVAAACGAAVEEAVFRGVIQVTLQQVAGRAGVLATSALFASTYLGAGSAVLVLVFVLAGLVFAYTMARTDALRAPIAGHVLLVLGAGGIWPTVLGRAHPSWLSASSATIGLGIASVGMIAVVLRLPVAP